MWDPIVQQMTPIDVYSVEDLRLVRETPRHARIVMSTIQYYSLNYVYLLHITLHDMAHVTLYTGAVVITN